MLLVQKQISKFRKILIEISATRLISYLIWKEADLAITDLTITSDRESAVDFTSPFMNLGKIRYSALLRIDDENQARHKSKSSRICLRLNQYWHFRYKCSLQAANDRSTEFAIISIAVFEGSLGISDRSVYCRDLAAILNRKALSDGMDKSISLYQRTRSIGNALHTQGYSILRTRRLTEGFYRIRARVSQSPLYETQSVGLQNLMIFFVVWN